MTIFAAHTAGVPRILKFKDVPLPQGFTEDPIQRIRNSRGAVTVGDNMPEVLKAGDIQHLHSTAHMDRVLGPIPRNLMIYQEF